MLTAASAPILLAASSGFLTPDNPGMAFSANHALVAAAYAICLLLSRNVDHAIEVIVERQLTRSFSRERSREARSFASAIHSTPGWAI